MNARQMTRTAFMAASLVCVFRLFAHVLYLELITFTIVLYATIFSRKEAVLACVIFACLNLCRMGITPWSLLYLLIYPTYALMLSYGKGIWEKHPFALSLMCAFLSFLTGQLLDLPYLIFGRQITMIYLLMGLKTSLIQGLWSFLVCLLLYDPLYRRLKRFL